MSETRKCPFCGTNVAVSPFGHIWCDQCDYRLETAKFNKRPVEDMLLSDIRAAQDENEKIVARLSEQFKEIQVYKKKLTAALNSLRDLTSNLEVTEEYGRYGSYYTYKWIGDGYLVDAAVSTVELLESEEQQ